MRAFIKSLVFNIAFFSYCFLASVFFFWSFALPRKYAFKAVLYYFKGAIWVERLFLGLDYAVSGQENLPPAGTPYILAVKHYSAYETLAVPVIFGDIAIILKKELTWIPLWGWYTIKLGMIPVDRGGGTRAIASLIRGGRRVIAEGRPILIFPQGTRVHAHETTADKPYKVGIAKIAQALDLPIVPVAINSAAFWPKHGFYKKAGVVDFQILPVIEKGLPPSEILARLESSIEPASAKLMENAKIDQGYKRSFWPRPLAWAFKIAVAAFVVWAMWWHALAYGVEHKLSRYSAPDAARGFTLQTASMPVVSGFPGVLRLRMDDVEIQNTQGVALHIPAVDATLEPWPAGRLHINAPHGVQVQGLTALPLDNASATLALPAPWCPPAKRVVTLETLDARIGETTLNTQGGAIAIPAAHDAFISGEMAMQISHYDAILESMAGARAISSKNARMAKAFFDAMAASQGQTGVITVPLKIHENVVYAGFVRLYEISR